VCFCLITEYPYALASHKPCHTPLNGLKAVHLTNGGAK
jgi:hypothetical protein